MTTELIAWLPTILTLLAVGGLYVTRIATKAQIERSIEFKFNTKLEKWRSELRISEDTFKDQLASKASEIAVLREAVFGGRATRRALVEKRRMVAIDGLWEEFIKLRRYLFAASLMDIFTIESIAKQVARNPEFKKFFETIAKNLPEPNIPDASWGKAQQPYVSPLAWGYFSAYQTVMTASVGLLKMLELGVEQPQNFLSKAGIADVLKAALPHRSAYIDQAGQVVHSSLLNEIENNLLAELTRLIQGVEDDQADIEQATAILAATAKAEEARRVAESKRRIAQAESGVVPESF
jgi:hypothetical protein